MRRPASVLTEQELEIMKVIWVLPSATVRDVYEELRKKRQIAYTTVMTMMNILEQKGYLKKSRQDRAYLYQATRPKKQVVHEMVRDFVGRVFDGAAQPLLVHLVQDRKLDEKDLQELRRMVRERQ
jgi:predicted transcriptional regulator